MLQLLKADAEKKLNSQKLAYDAATNELNRATAAAAAAQAEYDRLSGVTGSYGIGLQVQGSLIAEGLAAAGIADAFEVVVGVEVLLCAIAVVLAVRNLRETSEREAYRFAYDDLREGYLSLMQAAGQNTEEDNEIARLIAHEAERFADLTERELSVVRLVAQGMDNREIASTLFLSEGTVRNHISSILSKKALSNRTQIAVLYYRG